MGAGALLVLAGCGGSFGTGETTTTTRRGSGEVERTTTTPPVLTEDEWIASVPAGGELQTIGGQRVVVYEDREQIAVQDCAVAARLVEDGWTYVCDDGSGEPYVGP